MQVASTNLQHKTMIEAVENHNPEVIVIDEISTKEETEAARTIAERGVQLIATAHGNQLSNLMQNPILCDLVGGIEPVTLGDEEAKRRGTRKIGTRRWKFLTKVMHTPKHVHIPGTRESAHRKRKKEHFEHPTPFVTQS